MTPLRVALGVIAGVTGGPATYARELVRGLLRLSGEGLELVVLTDRPDLFPEPGLELEPIRLPSAYWQPWWDNVAVPSLVRKLGVHVYHATKNALPIFGLPASVASVVTIHDLAAYAEPETFSLAQRLQLRVHLRHAARRADRVICVSHHAASDVRARLAVPAERIAVVPHGVNQRFRPIEDTERRAAIRRAYGVGDEEHLVTYVGTLQPRKRIDVAILAFERVRQSGLRAELVIAGRRRPGFSPPWLESPPPHVRVVGELPDEALVDLLGASDAMLSPSSYEGFGLTFAEAMACGCPVIGVSATSVPEVVGDGGILVERHDVELVADALAHLLGDPRLHAEKVNHALARAATFSWARAAAATAEVYHAAARR